MSEIENTTPSGLNRRQILKGAAWSVPVLAAAVATPLASASTVAEPAIRIYGDCLLSAAGITVGQGFYVQNQGDGAFEGTITVTETITLSGAAAVIGVRNIVFSLMAVQGILGGAQTGISLGTWSGSGNTRSRTVTLSAPLAAGETRSWGNLADVVSGLIGTLDIVGLSGINHTATITSPTGNPPVTESADTLNYRLLDASC